VGSATGAAKARILAYCMPYGIDSTAVPDKAFMALFAKPNWAVIRASPKKKAVMTERERTCSCVCVCVCMCVCVYVCRERRV
jgi:hypothetical protein